MVEFFATTSLIDTENDTFRGVVSFLLLIMALALHEFAHAWTAWKLGDRTAKDQGRVTLNPLPHLDPIFSVALPLYLILSGKGIFGAGRPVPVDDRRLRRPNLHLTLVSMAGPAMNVLLALLFTGVFWFLVEVRGMSAQSYTGDLLWYATGLNLLLAAFNLLPVPPLDGHRLLGFFLPEAVRVRFYRMWWLGLLDLLGVYLSDNGFAWFVSHVLEQVEKMWAPLLPEGADPLFRWAGTG